MNRLVCSSTDAIEERNLPPRERDKGPGAPARVLFLHGLEVGFATTTGNLEHFAATRPDLDAVHVRLVMPRWLRLACKQSPVPIGELDYRYLRHMLFWRAHLRSLLGPGKKLPLDRFDVVHVTTQQRAFIIEDFRRPGRNPTGAKFAVNLDATLRGWEQMRALRRFAPPVDWALEGRILRSADMLACATEWAANSCIKEYDADPARVVIHKPCARIDDLTLVPPAAPRTGLPRIIFVGGNWADKGGDRLLNWHRSRWSDKTELHIVSGSAPRHTPAKNVVFHGMVPHDKLLRELLPAMDLFVVPTKWDTFLIAAQEAQAAGLPVVTTRTGGVGECVRNGVTGFLCDRASDEQYIAAVDKLLADPFVRASMGRAAREHARTDLSAIVWHNHLLDQLVALANGLPLRTLPAAHPAPSDRVPQ